MSAADPLAPLAEALAGPVLAELRQLRAEVAELREQLAAPKGGGLEPLADILGKSKPAARMIEARTPELRQLAVEVGKRRLYRREDVLAFFKARAA